MLDCQTEGDVNCKHCRASGDNQLYWGIQLDQDLLDTIVSIYPEWFKDYNMNLETISNIDSDQNEPVIPLSQSANVTYATKATANQACLQKAVEKNKESLTPSSAFHEQRQKLERAKMGDLLKNKIQKRSEKQVLASQHMLEDKNTDRNLQEKKRQLKKARLADELNDRISHRPGPIDLVKSNILHADEILAQAIREGSIPFISTSGETSPDIKISQQDDSESDGAISSSPPYEFCEHSHNSMPPLEPIDHIPSSHDSEIAAISTFCMSPPSSASSPLRPALASPPVQDQLLETVSNGLLHQNKDTPAKVRKKTKPKPQPKTRTIKFHEYKGPPSAQKNSTVPASSTETSYDLILQQQQLFLQWQLEWQQKYPHNVINSQKMNGDQVGQPEVIGRSQNSINENQAGSPGEPHATAQKLVSKLEDLKVSDLKAELKKRNLPVSGSKPLLIERLKSYSEFRQNLKANNNSVQQQASQSAPPEKTVLTTDMGSLLFDTSSAIGVCSSKESMPPSPISLKDAFTDVTMNHAKVNTPDGIASSDQPMKTVSPTSVKSGSTDALDSMDTSDSPHDTLSTNLVQLQKKCIENLQQELQRSQFQLQQSSISHQSPDRKPVVTAGNPSVPLTIGLNTSEHVPVPMSTISSTSSVPVSDANSSFALDNKFLQRQIIHQHLQQKILQQKLHMQQQKLLQDARPQIQGALAEPSPPTSKPHSNSALTALLESEPMHTLPLDITFESIPPIKATKSVEIASTDVFKEKPLAAVVTHKAFHENPSATCQVNAAISTITSSKPAQVSFINTVSNHRTSSLPSFSVLLNDKPLPTRSHTDPQFLLTRPPPDYDEATRQLNKIKQNFYQTKNSEENARQSKKHKSSIKCQAVDDVLEILIKNGELPPSAAQEPSMPPTPSSSKNNETVPISAVNTATSLPNVTSPSILAITSCKSEPTNNIHLASLQSVLDMTPPSSAGFGEPNNNTHSSLDFDFHLDVEDIEAMDIEGLSHESQSNHSATKSDSTLGQNFVEKPKSSNVELDQLLQASTQPLQPCELLELPDHRTDMDLIDWLEVISETTGASSSDTSSNFPQTTYYTGCENDPIFPNVESTADGLDLFSVDEMDFKSNDISLLPWDKTDFSS